MFLSLALYTKVSAALDGDVLVRCVMRIVCIAQADIAAVATMLVGKLTELLNELCKVLLGFLSSYVPVTLEIRVCSADERPPAAGCLTVGPCESAGLPARTSPQDSRFSSLHFRVAGCSDPPHRGRPGGGNCVGRDHPPSVSGTSERKYSRRP